MTIRHIRVTFDMAVESRSKDYDTLFKLAAKELTKKGVVDSAEFVVDVKLM